MRNLGAHKDEAAINFDMMFLIMHTPKRCEKDG